jgi:tetratricopeptide (TPR) repeat protein
LWLIQDVHAQSQLTPDSLIEALKKTKIRDSSYVNTLNHLSKFYRSLFPDSSLLFARKAKELADSIRFEKGIARSLNFMGIAQFFKGNLVEAQHLQMTSLKYSEEHHFVELTSNALNSLALALQYQGNYFSAMDYYLKALSIEEQRNNTLALVKVLSNMGTLYNRMEEYDEAIRVSERALALSSKLSSPKASLVGIYTTFGNAYAKKEGYDRAIPYMQQALKINKEIGNKLGAAMSNLNLGYFNLGLDRLDESEKYLTQALALAKSADIYETQALALMDLAEIRLTQKRYDEALVLAKESLKIFIEHSFKDKIVGAKQTLSRVYDAIGNHQAAYHYLNESTQLDDSLKSAAAKKKVNDLNNSYELHKKEAALAKLTEESQLREALLRNEQIVKWSLVALVVVLVFLFASFYYAFKLKSKLNKKLESQNKLINQINKELKVQALRAQMNPHFIFNSLNSIQFLIIKRETDRAFDYLAKFGLLLRKVMDNSEKKWITLPEEVEVLNLYLELESLRFGDSFSYEINTNTNNRGAFKIPPMVVQPYVENAIHHGLIPKEGNRQLFVTFSGDGNRLACEVRDNGVGREKAREISMKKEKIFSSKGMNFISERLQMLEATGDSKSEITIIDHVENERPAGTSVRLLFEYA